MRDVLIARIEPLARSFAEDLADLLVADVERRLEQLGEAMQVSLSTLASELAGEAVRDAVSHAASSVPEPALVAEQGSTLLPTIVARAAVVDTSARPRAAVAQIRVGLAEPTSSARNSGDSRDRPAPSGRKPNSCRKCGALGFTSQSCGKTHNVSTSPAPDAPTASTPANKRSASAPATSSLIESPPPNRSAGIGAAAGRREAARREREERAASFIRRDGSTRGASGSVEPDELEEEPRVASLPEVLASFDIDHGVYTNRVK